MGRGLVVTVLALLLAACGGKRTVAGSDTAGERGRQVPAASATEEFVGELKEATPRSSTRTSVWVPPPSAPQGSADGSTGPTFPPSPIDNGSLSKPARAEPSWTAGAPHPGPAPASGETESESESEAEAASIRGGTDPDPLSTALRDPAAATSRRQQFAEAVEAISTELGKPISAKRALAEMPCGGWSGPDCSNLTMGIEIAKLGAPTIARFHRKRTAEITEVLIEAVSIHSIWHDAFGYVHRKLKIGPGYTYAGCLFSRCDAGGFKNGQVDGILYQVGRLLGVLNGPACGPRCKLP